jgi:ornithine carbamoyltransferase
MTRHFLDIADHDAATLSGILDHARAMKARRKSGLPEEKLLAGKVLALVFDAPSTRTRVSFEVGIRQLGGDALMLTGAEMQLGRGETIADTARVLSRYVDGIMIRTLKHETVQELAEHATIPVINGLTKRSHPCQVMADIQTFLEHRGSIKGKRIAWSGDSNNVLRSWIEAAVPFDFTLAIASPAEFRPMPDVIELARRAGARIELTDDPAAAAKDADCIVTDTWVSMGDEDEDRRHSVLSRYQVTRKLFSHARPDAIFMHCLPAHRGEEVENEVIDGTMSVVFDEAENRLHAQKGILAWCFGAGRPI